MRSVLSEHWTQFHDPAFEETTDGVWLTVWVMESPLLGPTPVIPVNLFLDKREIQEATDKCLGEKIDHGLIKLADGDGYDPQALPWSLLDDEDDDDE